VAVPVADAVYEVDPLLSSPLHPAATRRIEKRGYGRRCMTERFPSRSNEDAGTRDDRASAHPL